MNISSKIALAMSANGASFEEVHTSLEKITYNFAIGFADWIRVCKLKGRPYDFENIEELLTIYKDEKDL